MLSVQLCTKTITVAKDKIDLDMYADTCIVGDNCSIIYDHKRPMNIYCYDSKARSKQACIVTATVAYDKSKMNHDFILLINQAIEFKSLDHHLLCSMKCCMNDFVIDEVLKFLHPVRPYMSCN